MVFIYKMCIRDRFHIISLIQEIIALLNAGNRIIVCILLNFNIPILYVISVHLIEDRLEIHLATCADLFLILDMDSLELARTVLQVSDRITTTHHYPVYIHLEEYVVRAYVCLLYTSVWLC